MRTVIQVKKKENLMSGPRLGAPSPALIISTVALISALGGTSYAAFSLPQNSVGAKQLKNKAVTLAKIAPAAQHALTKVGPQGPQGAQGVQGPQGIQGPKGAQVCQGQRRRSRSPKSPLTHSQCIEPRSNGDQIRNRCLPHQLRPRHHALRGVRNRGSHPFFRDPGCQQRVGCRQRDRRHQ